MQFCFRLLFRFHRDFFQWFGRPSSVNTVYTKPEIYTETTCLLLHTFVLLHAKIMFSNTLPIFHWPGKHIVVAYLTLLAESVLPVLNLIVWVKMGLCGWTKFGLVWEQFGKVACTVLQPVSHHVVTKHTHSIWCWLDEPHF